MEKQENNHLYGLDGLKALGCLAVAFFWHYQHFGNDFTPPLYSVFFLLYQSGGIAVELFLMISGFAMQMTYFNRIQEGELPFPQYISRRLRKIWPMAIITLLVVTVGELWYKSLTGGTFVVEHFDLYHFVLNCFLLQAGWWENSYSFNSPAWFLSTLLLCYVIYYLLVRVTWKNKKVFHITCLGIVAIGIVCLMMNCQLPFLHAGFAARGYICFYGGLLYELYAGGIKAPIWIGPTAGCICFAVILLLQHFDIVGNMNLRQLLCIFIVFPIAIIAACRLPIVERVLSIKPFRWLAGISMEVFLWHFSVQLFIACLTNGLRLKIDYSSVVFFCGYIVTVLVVAWVSAKTADKLRIKKEVR